MLTSLVIRNVVLIEALDVSLEAGLTALTGETGAGKSVVLDSLSLALGARGDAGLVKKGEERAQVTASFDIALSHPLVSALSEEGIDVADGLILKRVQLSDGRTRAFINDQPVSAQRLREVGAALVEIHGQHADRALVDTASHKALLDSFAAHPELLSEMREAYKGWRAAQKAYEAEKTRLEEAQREQDFIAHAAKELKSLDPQPGEEDSLSEIRAQMMQAEKVASDLNEAYEVISGHDAPGLKIGAVLRKLERKLDDANSRFKPVCDGLEKALHALADAEAEIEAAISDAQFDPKELERTEERLFALRAAARKFSVSVDDLPALRISFEDQLTALDEGEARLSRLNGEMAEARARAENVARVLSQKRKSAAELLSEAVNGELPPLKLEKAQFFVEVLPLADERLTEDGADYVEFMVQTNPGTEPGAIMKVASGGELSRFLLALKVVLADRGSAPTLIFDEIDTGVGGAVADAIGQRLRRLSHKVQVVSVTHAPQVAARSATHFLVAKEMSGPETMTTTLRKLDEGERQHEIARMLSGASITEEARAAAARLMQEAESAA